MTNILRSRVNEFARIILTPVDATSGEQIHLPDNAIVADVVSGEGARTRIEVIDDGDDRRFAVSLIPGDQPGVSEFKVHGAEGIPIVEETFHYTTTGTEGVGLEGADCADYLPKTQAPA